MTFDTSTHYLRMRLRSPVVASASPLTGHLDSLLALERAGAGAVVLPSLFEEQIENEQMGIHLSLELGAGIFGEATDGYLPEADRYNTGTNQYLDLIRSAKTALSIPVIGSLNGTTTGGWVRYSGLIENAGADALELNIYLVAADASLSAAEVEYGYLSLVEATREAVDLPLAVKIGPYFSSVANMGRRLVDAGADGLVLFNRFYQPDIDLETLDVVPNLVLSTSVDLRLALRWIAILKGRLETSLAATGGVHTAEDAVKLILAGADVTMMASALLRQGAEQLRTVAEGLVVWFSERDYRSLEQAKGSLSEKSVPDPSAFERANYMRALTTYGVDRR
jgi:dihydroorotate dehydrogenase (fumarate)